MGTRTLKIGTSVTVKETGTKGKVCDIQSGKYLLNENDRYFAHELVAEKITPSKPGKRAPINTKSDLTKKLQPVYNILRVDFLQHNRVCRIRHAGCTHHATEVHHMAGRAGWWLIVMKFFLATCRNCHRWATKNSKEAFEKAISIPKTSIPPEVTPSNSLGRHELHVLKRLDIPPP